MAINPSSIELFGMTPFIDFHFNNSSVDFTSRIIENATGQLNLIGKLRLNNNAPMSIANERIASLTCEAKSYVEGTKIITKSGYYPLGVIGHNFSNTSGASGLVLTRIYITNQTSGSGTLNIMVRNENDSVNATEFTIFVFVLWTALL